MSAPLDMARIGQLREAALSAEKAGRAGEAQGLFDAALALAPREPRLLNSAGGSALRLGDTTRAEALYARACKAAPGELEYAVNHAIVLEQLDRAGEAVRLLRGLETQGRHDARYWSTRGSAERASGDLAAASASYEACLALNAGHVRGLHGRARIALERGEGDASARYAKALAVNQGDANLWLGRAMALEAEGQFAEARQIADALSAQMPGWLDVHRYLAELRLNTEEGALQDGRFADHYAAASRALPGNAGLALAWVGALSGADCTAEAHAVGEDALARMREDPDVRVAAASAASAARDLARADALFADLPAREGAAGVLARVEEARHRLRCRDPERAEALLARALEDAPHDVSGWGLRSLAWRMLDDPREEWLHGQPNMVRRLPLAISDAQWDEIKALLHALHETSFVPVGQSVRGGSQTRGGLFARTEAPLKVLHDAILEVIETYRAGLPPCDPGHPLLARRDEKLAIAGSWSVRLGPGGRHTVHIHPQGVLSSALYIDLPPLAEDAPGAGCLEVGGAPPEMGLDLPPRQIVPPLEKHLTLFPSTLFHGTAPFAQGRRMTVAFDVAVRS